MSISKKIITNELIEKAAEEVLNLDNYGQENILITECLNDFPFNVDKNIIAMKIGLIDITNSTNISRYKKKISVVELAEYIKQIENIDKRIENGDPEVVNEIARSNGKINLFSFASKFCCYHNVNYYKKDDFSIFDNVLKNHLPEYFEITKSQIEKWRKEFDYKAYNDFITQYLDNLNIDIRFRKRKFDYFVWYKHR